MKENTAHNIEKIAGCYALRGSPCHGCGGGWPGTKSSSEDLTSAAHLGRLIPERMGCGPLEAQVKVFIKAYNLTLEDLEAIL